MSNAIKTVATKKAPQPFGHYVQATEAAGVVYVSGQLAACADGSSLADQSFEVQARRALANVVAIVEGAGLGRDRIARDAGRSPGPGLAPRRLVLRVTRNATPCRHDALRQREPRAEESKLAWP